MAKREGKGFRLAGKIWKVVVDELNKVLLIETREEETRTAKFSAFSLERFEFLWERKTLEEPWWVSLIAAHEGMILFSLYDGSERPEVKATLACRLADFSEVWSIDGASFHQLKKKVIIK